MATSPPPDAGNPVAPDPDRAFTFRIQRVQEWTLGTVIVAAVSLGVWIGTLTTKLDHIEKFVDSAENASAGIFVRLTTIQTTLDFLEKSAGQNSNKASGNIAPYPPIEVRIPPIEVRSNPTPEPSVLDKLIEDKLAKDFLKSGSETALQPPPLDKLVEYTLVENWLKSGGGIAPPVSPPAGVPSTSANLVDPAWMTAIKDYYTTQLKDLETKVKNSKDKEMSPEAKQQLISLIEEQQQRVVALKP
jgi:hypothetical protein